MISKSRNWIRQKHTPSPSPEGSDPNNDWNLSFDCAQGDAFWDLVLKNWNFIALTFLALMGTASSCGGVRHKRYSGAGLAPKH